MGSLSTRLERLEARAEEARLAPYRRLAAQYGIDVDELIAVAEKIERRAQQLLEEGMSIDEARAVVCAENDLGVDKLWTRAPIDRAPWEGRWS
jgi:DNA repair ATPase RecN